MKKLNFLILRNRAMTDNNVFTQTNDELVEKLERLPKFYQVCFDLWTKKNKQEIELLETKSNLKKAESELFNFINKTADEVRISTSELDHYILNDEVIISFCLDDGQVKFTYKPSFSSNDSLTRLIKKLRPTNEPIKQPQKEKNLDDILNEIAEFNLLDLKGMGQDAEDSLALLEKELFNKAKNKTLYGNRIILKPTGLDFHKVIINFIRPRIQYFYESGEIVSSGVIL